MNDEGIGIAGWLLADLVLVLAIVFLAFTPAALSGDSDDAEPAATPVAAPLILAIGCVEGEQAGRWTPVRCEPDLGGGEVSTYEWEADGGWARSLPGGDYFAASFADAGAVRLTVKNDGGERSAAFPVIPPTAEATVEGPLIRDLGCVRTEAEGRIDVRCEPELGGGEPSTYAWEAERGRARSPARGPTFAASFENAGAVRLTVANDGGEARTEFAVLPQPSTVIVPQPECSAVQTDFRFAQIVLIGARLGTVTWDDIANGRVRVDVIKSEELKKLNDIGTGEWSGATAEAFLRDKLGEGLRIALVETFSHESGGSHVSLSEETNDVLYEGLLGAGIRILRDPPADGRWKWFGDYLAPRALEPGEVRLNLYFVKPFDNEDCR